MRDIRIKNRRLHVGDESRPLLSGEVHYWRIPEVAWPTVLERIRDLGLTIISTYVPWQYHESGQYDFTSLHRFLDLAAAYDLWVMLRPGPYIYAEWVNNGVPDHAAHHHRLHPAFLEAAEQYMTAVVEAVRSYFGNPVMLLQADNEPEPWVGFYGRQLGLENEPGPFQDYLRSHYNDDIAALNAAWESDYTTFEQARAVTTPAIVERRYLNRYLDYRRFVYWYSSEIGRWASDTYRRLGVDIPLYLNHYPHHLTQNWRELEASGAFAGPDYYSHNVFSRDSWEHQEFCHLLRYTRTYSALPFIPEFQSGIWHGWHYISGILTADHYRLAAVSALLAGIAGWNWYMLVNRDNWYMAPINEWGRTRPELYDVFAHIVRLFHEIDPPSVEKLTDTALALDILDRSSEIGGFSDPVLTAVYQAGIDYECYDLATGSVEKPLMLYTGGRWLSEAGQRRLLDYVERGGTLVFFDQLPIYDDRMNPLNLLDLREPDGMAASANLRLMLGATTVETSSNVCFRYENVPGEPIHAERMLAGGFEAQEQTLHFHLPVGQQHVSGYRQGGIVVLGVTPTPALIHALHQWLDIPVYAHADSVSTALFRREDDFYLMVVHNGGEAQDVVVRLHRPNFPADRYQVTDLWTGDAYETDIRGSGQVHLRVESKSGTVLHLKPLDRS